MKKLIIFIFILLGMVSYVNALLIDNNNAYYKWDADLTTDATGNFTLTNVGNTLNTDGIIGNASDFSGTSHMTQSGGAGTDALSEGTINVWYKFDDEVADYNLFAKSSASFRSQYSSTFDAVNWQVNGEGQSFRAGAGLDWTVYHMVTYVWTSTNKSIYIDGVFANSTSLAVSSPSGTLFLGHNSVNTNERYKGLMDEFGTWDRALTDSEISQLYNSGSGLQYPFPQGTIITFNNPTEGQYLNSTSFILNVSFSDITNSTYSLNGGSNQTLGTNENQSTASLIGVEGLNNITIYTNTSGTLSNSSISFTIDTTNPIIINNLPSEINTFDIDFSSYITINETNPYTCRLEVLGQTNTTCDNSTFIFDNSGNNTINIYVNDSAGNTATDLNNILLVNPEAYFNVQFNGTPLTGYTLGGRSDVNGTVSFNYYNDGLVIGNNSLTFEKLGYATQSINFVLNTPYPNFNQTFNVSQAQINIFIKDKNTLDLITGVNFTIDFIASVGLTTSTTTGTKTLTNTLFQNEQYQVTVFADNYTTESVFFNFNNQESLDITLYSYDVTSPLYGVVDIKVVDTFGAAIEGAIVEALQWDSNSSSFIRVSQGLTTENGKSLLNIILNNKLYRFKASFGEFSKNTTQQYIPELLNGKEIIITLGDEITTATGLFENIDYTITESFSNDTYQSNISFSWVNRDGLDTTGCIKYYRVQPSGLKTLLTNDCSTGASVDDLSVSKTLNSTYYIWAEVGFEQDGIFFIQQRFKYSPTFDISQILKETNLALYILPFIYLVAVFVGMLNPFVGASLLILDNILAAYLVPQYMNGYIIAFMYFIAGLIMYAGGKRQ